MEACFCGTQLEVGGEDTAVLNAVTNVLGNLPAALSPAVGIYLRRVTGSWVPFFGGASTLLLLRWLEANGMASGSCSVFARWIELRLWSKCSVE